MHASICVSLYHDTCNFLLHLKNNLFHCNKLGETVSFTVTTQTVTLERNEMERNETICRHERFYHRLKCETFVANLQIVNFSMGKNGNSKREFFIISKRILKMFSKCDLFVESFFPVGLLLMFSLGWINHTFIWIKKWVWKDRQQRRDSIIPVMYY